jgi:hypothetical protein
MKLSSGLIIRAEPLADILNGHKVWEMRGIPRCKRGTIALIQKGSKAIQGIADITEYKGPLSKAELLANEAKHLVQPSRLDDQAIAEYRYAWVLANVRRLKYPVSYRHTAQVRFVTLDQATVRAISEAL